MMPGSSPLDGEPRNAASTALKFVSASMKRRPVVSVYPSTTPRRESPAIRRCSASYTGAVTSPSSSMVAQRSSMEILAVAVPRLQFSLLFTMLPAVLWHLRARPFGGSSCQ